MVCHFSHLASLLVPFRKSGDDESADKTKHKTHPETPKKENTIALLKKDDCFNIW